MLQKQKKVRERNSLIPNYWVNPRTAFQCNHHKQIQTPVDPVPDSSRNSKLEKYDVGHAYTFIAPDASLMVSPVMLQPPHDFIIPL